MAGSTIRIDSKEFPWRLDAVITVGRDPECDVVVPSPVVSHIHLRIEAVADGTWLLHDSSRNGAFIDGRKVDGEQLRSATLIHLGPSGSASVRIDIIPVSAEPAQPPPSAPEPTAPPKLPLMRSSRPSRPVDGLGRSVGVFAPSTKVVRIGRDPSNDLVLTGDPRASRRHAELRRRDDGEWEIQDLGSANGTFVNGDQAKRAMLSNGDLLSIGNHTFVFRDGELEQVSQADDTSLDVSGISVTTEDGATLLHEVSFSLPSRSVLAVVGPSGAGKTTLLSALTGTLTPSRGQVRFAGRDLHASYEEFRSRIGLVPQDDLVHPELTPRTELELAAALRLPPDTGRDGRRVRVRQVLDELGMTERADLQIAKLSGGQRKRVSVGTELLTEPTLLFLDEPTSGLDPGNERQVMSVLRHLADGGRFVVVVTHATQSLDLADRVLFLTRGGRVAYYGPPGDAPGYFARHGVTGGYAEIFRTLDDPGDVDWSARFRSDPAHDRYVGNAVRQAAARRDTTRRPSARATSPVPVLGQLQVLIERQARIIRGDPRTMVLLAVQPLAFGLIIAFLFSPTTMSTVHGPFAALLLWLLVISGTWLGASGTIREIVKELPIYRRERAVGLPITAYVLSKFAVFGAITVVQSLVLVAIGLSRQTLPARDPQGFIPVVIGLGRAQDPSHFDGLRPFATGSILPDQRIEIAIAVALAGLAGTALGLAISALVRKSDQAVFLLPVALVVQMALSLPLLKLQNASPLMQQLSKITSANWALADVASTVSLNQVLTPYLWDLTFGQQDLKGLLTTGQRLNPTPAQVFAALKTDPSWQHNGSAWLTAALILILMTAALLAVVVAALRRMDIGRRPLGRRG